MSEANLLARPLSIFKTHVSSGRLAWLLARFHVTCCRVLFHRAKTRDISLFIDHRSSIDRSIIAVVVVTILVQSHRERPKLRFLLTLPHTHTMDFGSSSKGLSQGLKELSDGLSELIAAPAVTAAATDRTASATAAHSPGDTTMIEDPLASTTNTAPADSKPPAQERFVTGKQPKAVPSVAVVASKATGQVETGNENTTPKALKTSPKNHPDSIPGIDTGLDPQEQPNDEEIQLERSKIPLTTPIKTPVSSTKKVATLSAEKAIPQPLVPLDTTKVPSDRELALSLLTLDLEQANREKADLARRLDENEHVSKQRIDTLEREVSRLQEERTHVSVQAGSTTISVASLDSSTSKQKSRTTDEDGDDDEEEEADDDSTASTVVTVPLLSENPELANVGVGTQLCFYDPYTGYEVNGEKIENEGKLFSYAIVVAIEEFANGNDYKEYRIKIMGEEKTLNVILDSGYEKDCKCFMMLGKLSESVTNDAAVVTKPPALADNPKLTDVRVGALIAVYDEEYKGYFRGRVRTKIKPSKRHPKRFKVVIKFDYGREETYNLTKTPFMLHYPPSVVKIEAVE